MKILQKFSGQLLTGEVLDFFLRDDEAKVPPLRSDKIVSLTAPLKESAHLAEEVGKKKKSKISSVSPDDAIKGNMNDMDCDEDEEDNSEIVKDVLLLRERVASVRCSVVNFIKSSQVPHLLHPAEARQVGKLLRDAAPDLTESEVAMLLHYLPGDPEDEVILHCIVQQADVRFPPVALAEIQSVLKQAKASATLSRDIPSMGTKKNLSST